MSTKTASHPPPRTSIRPKTAYPGPTQSGSSPSPARPHSARNQSTSQSHSNTPTSPSKGARVTPSTSRSSGRAASPHHSQQNSNKTPSKTYKALSEPKPEEIEKHKKALKYFQSLAQQEQEREAEAKAKRDKVNENRNALFKSQKEKEKERVRRYHEKEKEIKTFRHTQNALHGESLSTIKTPLFSMPIPQKSPKQDLNKQDGQHSILSFEQEKRRFAAIKEWKLCEKNRSAKEDEFVLEIQNAQHPPDSIPATSQDDEEQDPQTPQKKPTFGRDNVKMITSLANIPLASTPSFESYSYNATRSHSAPRSRTFNLKEHDRSGWLEGLESERAFVCVDGMVDWLDSAQNEGGYGFSLAMLNDQIIEWMDELMEAEHQQELLEREIMEKNDAADRRRREQEKMRKKDLLIQSVNSHRNLARVRKQEKSPILTPREKREKMIQYEANRSKELLVPFSPRSPRSNRQTQSPQSEKQKQTRASHRNKMRDERKMDKKRAAQKPKEALQPKSKEKEESDSADTSDSKADEVASVKSEKSTASNDSSQDEKQSESESNKKDGEKQSESESDQKDDEKQSESESNKRDEGESEASMKGDEKDEKDSSCGTSDSEISDSQHEKQSLPDKQPASDHQSLSEKQSIDADENGGKEKIEDDVDEDKTQESEPAS
ncbi:hypothetical protein BLNAU_18704 [Blattamonas nauphoetae]|uniref:Uncharacterized protein n=1 Tax=Blattamonas nauphoetae TaxID=2049346 RepID=A0ABQ9X3I9_9EUKA|nr:hypothetical protein BLNAU_18704 [Blattamonas nauphoetae]